MRFGSVLRTMLVFVLLGGVATGCFAGCSRAKPKKDKPADRSVTQKKEKAVGKTAELSFHSFDGGGMTYSVVIGDPAVLSCSSERKYNKKNHEEIDGAAYDVIFTFKGLKSGGTTVTVTGTSPIMDTEIMTYSAAVDEKLNVTLTERETVTQNDPMSPVPQLVLHTGSVTVYPSAADTDTTRELIDLLSSEPADMILKKTDFGYGGTLPWPVMLQPEELTAEPGDILLSGEDRFVLCTAEQIGAFTRLASLDETVLEKLLSALADDPNVSLWVEWSE